MSYVMEKLPKITIQWRESQPFRYIIRKQKPTRSFPIVMSYSWNGTITEFGFIEYFIRFGGGRSAQSSEIVGSLLNIRYFYKYSVNVQRSFIHKHSIRYLECRRRLKHNKMNGIKQKCFEIRNHSLQTLKVLIQKCR